MGLKRWLGLRKPPVSPFTSVFPEVKSYAQLDQDLWALAETGSKRGGFFVEIGAFDGVSLSNTYLLEKSFGWAGILAEPNPLFADGIKTIRNAPLCTQPVDGWSGKEVTMLFVADAPELSAMSSHAFKDRWAKKRETGIQVKQVTISLNDLLVEYDAPCEIDFMSIDTEGNEPDILSSFDFARYSVKLFDIEHNNTDANAKLDEMLISKGYERVHRGWSQWDAWYRKAS